jgi:hypothetical protein
MRGERQNSGDGGEAMGGKWGESAVDERVSFEKITYRFDILPQDDDDVPSHSARENAHASCPGHSDLSNGQPL